MSTVLHRYRCISPIKRAYAFAINLIRHYSHNRFWENMLTANPILLLGTRSESKLPVKNLKFKNTEFASESILKKFLTIAN